MTLFVLALFNARMQCYPLKEALIMLDGNGIIAYPCFLELRWALQASGKVMILAMGSQVQLSSPKTIICTTSSWPCRVVIIYKAHHRLVETEIAGTLLSLCISLVMVLLTRTSDTFLPSLAESCYGVYKLRWAYVREVETRHCSGIHCGGNYLPMVLWRTGCRDILLSKEAPDRTTSELLDCRSRAMRGKPFSFTPISWLIALDI